MAPPQLVPDKNTLQHWIDEGLTHQQMADRVFELEGHRVTRNAISNAMMRYGLSKEGPRYKEEIPWRVKVPHAKAFQLRMLRLLGRRRLGRKLNSTESMQLHQWLGQLSQEGAVVAYDPESDLGLVYISEKWKDHDGESPVRIKEIHLDRDIHFKGGEGNSGGRAVAFCDICQSNQEVASIVVVREYGKRDPWEADICEECYEKSFSDLRKASRRPQTSNVRPQHRFKITEVSEKNL